MVRLLPNGRVQCETWNVAMIWAFNRRSDVLDLRSFAFAAEGPLPVTGTKTDGVR